DGLGTDRLVQAFADRTRELLAVVETLDPPAIRQDHRRGDDRAGEASPPNLVDARHELTGPALAFGTVAAPQPQPLRVGCLAAALIAGREIAHGPAWIPGEDPQQCRSRVLQAGQQGLDLGDAQVARVHREGMFERWRSLSWAARDGRGARR